MIQSKDFDRVVYKKPRLKDTRPILSNLFGIDSEAYTTGEPFILCTCQNDVFDPKQVPHCFFTPKYENANFFTWNLKYDSGAILYFLPRELQYSLWEIGKASYFHDNKLYRFQYVPHKLLRIHHKRQKVSFWEISQFYRSSLDKAAQKYLDQAKRPMQTKNFTPAYYARFRKAIIKYCVQDAYLTRELGIYLIRKLGAFGITASSLYSSASISFNYFARRSKIVTVWRYWQDDQTALKYAADAYQGGKFEVTARGPFTGAEYDITSAYPYEIANLVDISKATTVYTTEYQPKAVYGFLTCLIHHYDPHTYLPCGPKPYGVNLYPLGTYTLTITKEEYDYIKTLKTVKIEVLSAVWFFVKRKSYPYRKTVNELFKIKSDMKNKDKMLYNITKVCLNGYYGKMAQSIEQPDGSVIVGQGWNPIYAAVITANTRIKVTRIQNLLKDDCIAVHTDSVILTKPFPKSIPLDSTLGNFGHVIDGSGIVIACGMYQISNLCAFKGLRPKRGETWHSILSRFPHRKSIPYVSLHVESWIEAMAKNHPSNKINLFQRAKKVMDLNCDTKRLWSKKATAQDLLQNYEISSPKTYIEKT